MGDEGVYWKASAKMLAGMIHLMRGTLYIYQGEEIGMVNAHYPSIAHYRDLESLNYYRILLENYEGREINPEDGIYTMEPYELIVLGK